MQLSVERSPRERMRLLAWVFLPVSVFTAAWLLRLPSMREAPGAAVVGGMALGLFATWVVDRRIGASIRALRVARLGTAADRMAFLDDPAEAGATPARAFVAVEAGNLEAAGRIVAGLRAEKKKTPEETLAILRHDLASAAPAKRGAVVDALVAWDAAIGGLHGLELERYRAFVLAESLHDDRGMEKTAPVAKMLFASEDEQVRGYAAWLVLEDEDPKRALACPHGAALARHHGHADLARTLDAQGSRLLAGVAPTPHRT